MQATLYVLPGSHPCHTARLMLKLKGYEVNQVDLIPVISKGVLRAAGFDGVTAPAVKIGDERIQGSRTIAEELERRVPNPPLYPNDPEARIRVEEAERWGVEVLQPVPRRMLWNLIGRDQGIGESYLRGAKLGIPVKVAAKTVRPLTYLSKRFNGATDAAIQRDLRDLPAMLERVDQLIADGVIGGEQLNAADFQIAPSLRLLMTSDDIRPAIADRPSADLAIRVLPAYNGYAPRLLPPRWLEPLEG